MGSNLKSNICSIPLINCAAQLALTCKGLVEWYICKSLIMTEFPNGIYRYMYTMNKIYQGNNKHLIYW